MTDEPREPDALDPGSSSDSSDTTGSSPEGRPRQAVTLSLRSAALIAAVVLAIGAAIGYGLLHASGQKPSPPAKQHGTADSRKAGPEPNPGTSSPQASGGRSYVIIPMSSACRWAYPGRASGQHSGTDYSIACLDGSGNVLGGFSGSHSLNAWCADPRHTNGSKLLNPALVRGVWLCTSPSFQPSSFSPGGSGGVSGAGGGSAGGSGAGSNASPVAIPLSSACEWAYPGRASGQHSGAGYSIACLDGSGNMLGGFSGSHSLNAWCADTSHTNGSNLPNPALVRGTWMCTSSGRTTGPSGGSSPPTSPKPSRSPKPTKPSSVVIPLSSACKWAYPGQASGQHSGTDYSIVCLDGSGNVLGGFSGSHSLNAWCADPSHTNGSNLPNPVLVRGEWRCSK